jgi:hypothetical protein
MARVGRVARGRVDLARSWGQRVLIETPMSPISGERGLSRRGGLESQSNIDEVRPQSRLESLERHTTLTVASVTRHPTDRALLRRLVVELLDVGLDELIHPRAHHGCPGTACAKRKTGLRSSPSAGTSRSSQRVSTPSISMCKALSSSSVRRSQ